MLPLRRRNPAAAVVAGPFALQAGPAGVTLGRFAWADLTAGLVSNVWAQGLQLGFAIATYGMRQWNRVYWQCRQPVLRAGMGMVLMCAGDFRIRFQFGASPGGYVWANPADGTAAAADGGGFIKTPWVLLQPVGPCGLGRISSSVVPFH